MQEDVENRTVAVTLSATRFTSRTLARLCLWLWRKMTQGDPHERRETVKDLMKKGEAPSLPFSGETREFDRFARKHMVDYEFRKLEPGKYLLFFKSAQADNIRACLADYAKSVLGKRKGRSIVQELQKGTEKTRAATPPERVLTRETAHHER